MTRLIKELKQIDSVLNEVIKYVKHGLRVEIIDVTNAHGHYLAEDIYALIDVPPFDRAVVDGFAIKAEDTYSASLTNPIILKVVKNRNFINHGEAIEVNTGDLLPNGANAVIMYEDVVIRNEYIEVLKPVHIFENVSIKGEDFKKGELVYKKGTKLRSYDIATLIAIGYKKVSVYKPRVALICTGNELVDFEKVENIEKIIQEGKIINTNRYLLELELKKLGCEIDYLGTLPDDEYAIQNVIEKALKKYDFVITTGGISVGRRDLTIEVIKKFNPEYLVRGLAIRPGKPTGVAVIDGKLIFLLSGFPVASYIGFEILVKPIVLKLMGCDEIPKIKLRGRLMRRITKPINVKAFVRAFACFEDSELKIEPLILTGSGLLSTLVKGNVIIEVPEEKEGFDENEIVEVEVIKEIPKCK